MHPTTHGTFSAEQLARLAAAHAEAARWRAETSRAQAREMHAIHVIAQIVEEALGAAGASGRAAEMLHRETAAELGATLRVHDRTAAGLIDEARLIDAFPAAFEAFAAGRILRGHLLKIVDAGSDLDDAASRAAYEAAIVPIAERETPGRTGTFARAAAERLHPRSFAERHDAAASARGIWVRDMADGMSELGMLLPSERAHGIIDRVKRMARSVRDANRAARARAGGDSPTAHGDEHGFAASDPRSTGQIEADLLADMLLTGAPTAHAGTSAIGAIRGRVQVQIPILTLLGRGNAPATLVGVGPMSPETARELAGAARGWDRILTDPIAHSVLAVDRYTPSESLKRTLQVRDEHCRFPGCRQPVSRSDIDHTIDYARGGETRENNLAHLCRGHHMLKHESAWTVRQRPGGVLEWTSPTGRVFPDVPASSVRFVPEEDWGQGIAASGAGVGGANSRAAGSPAAGSPVAGSPVAGSRTARAGGTPPFSRGPCGSSTSTPAARHRVRTAPPAAGATPS